ncbi:hypothetical protein KR222_002245 [Zaprionus bogoriensis]|nr:hypothetical protein KR222_002245 [Zaprionus bogoriensis]
MFDLVKLLLSLCYYLSRLLGVLNIEIDLRTGRARQTRRALIYAMLMHLAGTCMLHQFQTILTWKLLWKGANRLDQYIFLMTLATRLVYIYVTLLMRSWHRGHLVRLINSFRRLALLRPQIVQHWRRGVISKIISMIAMQLLQVLIVICLVGEKKQAPLAQSLIVCTAPGTLLDFIAFQFYFALLNVYAYHMVLNRELRQVVIETGNLRSLVTRRAMFMIHCCTLADRLEDIARRQSQLQALVNDLSGIFGLQLLFVSANYYMYMVGLIFFTYSVWKRNISFTIWNTVGLILTFANIMFYALDMYITCNVLHAILDLHADMTSTLAGYTAFGLQLDCRLEAVYESFVLQLVRNPLKLTVLHMFNIRRQNAIILLNSVVCHSVVLVEYDMENFRRP